MKQLERGYSGSAKYICCECMEEKSIRLFIERNSINVACSYCGKSVAAPLASVVKLIVESLNMEYDDPVNGVGWSSGDGGWIGVDGKIWDTDDLLYDLDIETPAINDIVSLIHQTEWVDADPYGPLPHEQLELDWEKFAKSIKSYCIKRKCSIDAKCIQDMQKYSKYNHILDSIGFCVEKLGLVTTWPEGSLIYRARQSRHATSYRRVSELGPPQPSEAKYPNRMSPAGESMFYGALDELTCINEIAPNKNCPFIATVATWKTIKDINILDLSALPRVPSIFNSSKRRLRTPIRFLYDFLQDFSKKIIKDGTEQIEYLPTQIVTNYFRNSYCLNRKSKIDGIIYKSSQSNGSSCALFFGQDDCTNEQDLAEGKAVLCLLQSSIKEIPFG
ncbi:HEPN-associated N-terminal domain-containing protein [Desulfovibrio sp. TomC]|uniref:HEPN-associated N-terminal domain-containing protein n=1 Tax=Desulfovibrio sp. TomC TaxID=1562888 RepID=UPI0018CED5D0|nr:HEPN-associated N-terminal domain-containing protein [Desulfovibrio sp. TomC]